MLKLPKKETHLVENSSVFFENLLERKAKRESVDEPGRCEEARHGRVDVRTRDAGPQTRGDGLIQHLHSNQRHNG